MIKNIVWGVAANTVIAATVYAGLVLSDCPLDVGVADCFADAALSQH